MTALKCKLCGGNIEITGESHGICDSCGSEVTLPKIDDDKRADMYNRGNHFRQIGDFDRAYSAYEHIIADDETDAEAHWCLTLCRYGVEYVKDPRSGEFKPTVSRMNYERVLDDPDYLAALDASDEYTKEIYRREAQKIDRIQSRYLAISREEPPYDVFICFKAEEENGQRTKGSVLAQDAYEKLTEKGLKVFFSRITLENMLSEEYEPYIFAALHSAKVMLLTADKPEQLQARWVKNEWSRYLNMMEQDKSKHIVPVFVDMSPYDFPAEIPMVQGQDMSRIGAMQDLVRGVCKLAGRTTEMPVISVGGGVSVSGLLTRIRQALEDEAFEEADRLVDEALNREPENGELYYYGLLSKHRVNAFPEAERVINPQVWLEDRYFKRVKQYGSEERRQELLRFERLMDEAAALKEARGFAQSKEYEKAMEVLVRLEESIRQAGYSAYHAEEIRRCRSEWAGFAAKEKQLREDLAAYHEQVGLASTYITRKIRERDPDKTKAYEELLDRQEKYEGQVYQVGKGYILLFCALAALALSVYLVFNHDLKILAAWALMAGIANLEEKKEKFSVSSVIAGAIIGAIFYGIFYLIQRFIPFDAVWLLLPLISIIWGPIEKIKTTRATMALDSVKKEIEDLEQNFLRPLEKELRDQVTEEWTEKIGAGNLEELPGYQVKG